MNTRAPCPLTTLRNRWEPFGTVQVRQGCPRTQAKCAMKIQLIHSASPSLFSGEPAKENGIQRVPRCFSFFSQQGVFSQQGDYSEKGAHDERTCIFVRCPSHLGLKGNHKDTQHFGGPTILTHTQVALFGLLCFDLSSGWLLECLVGRAGGHACDYLSF